LTPLLAAARYNLDHRMVETLLAAGADLNAAYRPYDNQRERPLNMAARHNRNPRVAEVLLEAGADLEFVGHDPLDRRPPLALAAKYNPNPEVFRLFLARGADVAKAGGPSGLVVLAARNPNHLVLAETLKLAGDSERPEPKALAEALYESLCHCRPASALMLLAEGAPINDQARVEIGRTALMVMLTLGYKPLAEIEARGRLKDLPALAAKHLGQAYGPEIEAIVNDFKIGLKTISNPSPRDYELGLTSADGRVQLLYTTKSHPDSGIKIIKPQKGSLSSYKCGWGIYLGTVRGPKGPDGRVDFSRMFIN